MDLAKAQAIALELMKEHGLLEKGWRFEWFPARRMFGQCCFPGLFRVGKRYVKQIARIRMSSYLTQMNPESEFRSTLIHEISHALTGPNHGHDSHWRKIAISLGDDGERCYGDHVKKPEGRWEATCTNCKKVSQRHRRPTHGISCGTCSSKFSPELCLMWKDKKTGEVGQIHPKTGKAYNKYASRLEKAS